MSAPFMQLYVADYLGDTRHLTTEQHGAYLLLLMTMWRSDGRLPNDDKKLARIAGCTPSRWTKIKDDVLEFFAVDGGEITNARLTLELEKASEKSIKRAVSGTKGGRAKALKYNKPLVANASRSPKHSSEPEPDTTEANAPVVLARPSKADVAKGFLAFWSAYPRRVGKDAAAKAFSKALLRIDDPDPLAVILAGIERALPGWDDPQFIPHPSTWLTQGRWADDAPEPRTETRNDRPSSSNRPGSSYAQPSRAERDQSAALRVLAARGALPGPGEGGRVHDLGPARPAAAGG